MDAKWWKKFARGFTGALVAIILGSGFVGLVALTANWLETHFSKTVTAVIALIIFVLYLATMVGVILAKEDS